MITAEPIDIAKLLQQAHRAEAGAVVLFSGEVRNNHNGKAVQYLEYEAYIPMAEKIIDGIVQQAIERWKLCFASAVHRIGRVEISESAVVVITVHGHRKEAYEANQYIIDKIKSDAPIWKCEHYTDGSLEWGKNEGADINVASLRGTK
jgi:molybdopterin synthase catalytic subunit